MKLNTLRVSASIVIAGLIGAGSSGVPANAAATPKLEATPFVLASGHTLTSSEAQTMLETLARQRVADVLVTTSPNRPTLVPARSSKKFNAKREIEKPIVAARKERLKGFGFYYSSASTTVNVVDISGTAIEATVKFDELSKMYLASYASGPSPTPEQTRVRQTARFINTGAGWTLDDWSPDNPQGLPSAIVDHSASATNLSPEVKKPQQQANPGQIGAIPGTPGNTKPKPGTASAAAHAAVARSSENSTSNLRIAAARTTNGDGNYTAALASTGYNYTAMVNYTYQYWYYYNPSYNAYPSDCTNFVSQALRAGGWGMVDNATWYTDNNNWYYYPWVATRSWTSVADFFTFAIYGSGRTYELAYLNSMGPADVEIADWDGNGTKDHAMMVTSWAAGGGWAGYNDIRVTYHTNDTRDMSIWSLYVNNPGGIWYALRT
ncbi:amidase domain-containing protein [Arthrobacter sp. M4]|uniref:amidase domain-containing protein n=1 Tax=Arthrobacter sp. M4 TaxID=218160 RepID=UPI001CDC10E8|nr:amidase domain-containing protein [Arthrobacter sp. M4]MCA4133081.1 amidase domain-containing protein [Arthrobacter sp. M4]